MALLVLSAALAAEPRDPATRDPATPPRDTGRETTARDDTKSSAWLDGQLAACLVQANKAEITLAQIAQKKASDREVKDFAEKLVEDHTAFLAKLEKFDTHGEHAAPARDIPRTTKPATTTDRDAVPERTTKAPREESAPRTFAATDNHMATMMQIKKDLDERCLATAERELSQKEGAEFDRCFMGMQVMGHLKMADTLAVFKKYASPDLQQVIAAGAQTTQEHLAEAKQYMKKVETAAAKSDTTKK
jgi:predicted outer membrane protein